MGPAPPPAACGPRTSAQSLGWATGQAASRPDVAVTSVSAGTPVPGQVGTPSATMQTLADASPSPSSITVLLSQVKPQILPCTPQGARPEWGFLRSDSQHWG